MRESVAERKPKGGMLALEMGLGKTLCIIAAHALEQHLLPDTPEMHTEHTEEALEHFEVVLVGKRIPEDPESENLKETNMYTGFKQLDDGKGTIVPDGSVRTSFSCLAACITHFVFRAALCQRPVPMAPSTTECPDQCVLDLKQSCHCFAFGLKHASLSHTDATPACGLQVKFTGRGNLVVVPPTLAMQWEKEILERSTRQQNVIVVDDLKQRRHFQTSLEGMRACVSPFAACITVLMPTKVMR
jgi:hypothetical protein